MNARLHPHVSMNNENALNNDRQINTLTHLKANAARALSSCHETMRILLNKRNIHTPPAIQLTMALNGYVVVNGNRQDKVLLEDMLNSNALITEGLKEVEVLHRMVYTLTASTAVDTEIFHVGLTSLGAMAFFTKA